MRDLLKMDRPVARAGQAVLLALAVSRMSNPTLYDAYIGDFFCVSLGFLLAYGFRNRELRTEMRRSCEAPVRV